MTDDHDRLELRLAPSLDEALRDAYRAHLVHLRRWNPTVDPDATTLEAQWFEKPGVLFPWRIELDGRLVGFALVGNQRLAAAMNAEADAYLHEFHVLEPFRGSGIGRRAVERLEREHPGRWCMDVLPANAPAMAFWRAVLEHRSPALGSWTDDGVAFTRFLVPGA